LLRERVLGEPLTSNGLPLWLHYSGFQASCYNKNKFVLKYKVIARVVVGPNTFTVAQLVVPGDDKETQFLGV
jgi:hypothetical protein